MKRILFLIFILALFTSFSPMVGKEGREGNVVSLKNNVVVSPNPARTVTNVIVNNSSLRIKRVEIYSMVNEKVISLTTSSPASSVEINVYKLNKGKYFVKVFLSDDSEEFASLIKI